MFILDALKEKKRMSAHPNVFLKDIMHPQAEWGTCFSNMFHHTRLNTLGNINAI